MQKSIYYIALAAIFWGCKSIDKIEPNQKETFLKIYGESNTTIARDVLELEDGFIVLGTTGSSESSGDTTTILFKTDLLGNKIWGNLFEGFRARSIVEINDGYIMVGDSIDDTNQSFMNLLKTDLEGNKIASISPQVPYTFDSHGFAVTYTSDNEVVAAGYNFSNSSKTNSKNILVGYDANLTETWTLTREYGASNQLNVPYLSIYETSRGDLAWASASISGSNVSIKSSITPPDSNGQDGGSPIFIGSTILNTTEGGLVKMPVGYAVVQNVQVGQEEKIGISTFDENPLEENILKDDEFENGRYVPTAIANTPNGLLIAAYTDQHKDTSIGNRTDWDLFIVEVRYDGIPKTGGIKNTFGGLGNEVPVRVKNTADGGYLILGNLTNTKGAQQIFLLKINSKGELN